MLSSVLTLTLTCWCFGVAGSCERARFFFPFCPYPGNVCEYFYKITVYCSRCRSVVLRCFGLSGARLFPTRCVMCMVYQRRAFAGAAEANNNNNCNNRRWCVFCICLVWRNHVSHNFLVFSGISLHFTWFYLLLRSRTVFHISMHALFISVSISISRCVCWHIVETRFLVCAQVI